MPPFTSRGGHNYGNDCTQKNFSRVTLLQSSSIRCLCHEKKLKRNKMLANLHNLRYCLAFTEYLGKVLKWLIILRKIKVKIIFIQSLSTLIFCFIIYSWSVVPLAMFLCLSIFVKKETWILNKYKSKPLFREHYGGWWLPANEWSGWKLFSIT